MENFILTYANVPKNGGDPDIAPRPEWKLKRIVFNRFLYPVMNAGSSLEYVLRNTCPLTSFGEVTSKIAPAQSEIIIILNEPMSQSDS